MVVRFEEVEEDGVLINRGCCSVLYSEADPFKRKFKCEANEIKQSKIVSSMEDN